MSDTDAVGAVVTGLASDRGTLVFAALVLVGCYFACNNMMKRVGDQAEFFAKSKLDQLNNIAEELKKTRESLIVIQESYTHIESEVQELKEKIEKARFNDK